MHITCEGKAYELFEGATPQNLWNMVSRGRDPETAVLADCEGDIIDFQTPFTGDTDVKWIPLGSPLAHRAYQRSYYAACYCCERSIWRENRSSSEACFRESALL